MAIIPFELLFTVQRSSDGKINELARLARMGRMYKLIKIMRLFKLLRLAKVAKGGNEVVKKFSETLKIGIGFKRLLFILIVFFFFTHVVSCIWIMSAKF